MSLLIELRFSSAHYRDVLRYCDKVNTLLTKKFKVPFTSYVSHQRICWQTSNPVTLDDKVLQKIFCKTSYSPKVEWTLGKSFIRPLLHVLVILDDEPLIMDLCPNFKESVASELLSSIPYESQALGIDTLAARHARISNLCPNVANLSLSYAFNREHCDQIIYLDEIKFLPLFSTIIKNEVLMTADGQLAIVCKNSVDIKQVKRGWSNYIRALVKNMEHLLDIDADKDLDQLVHLNNIQAYSNKTLLQVAEEQGSAAAKLAVLLSACPATIEASAKYYYCDRGSNLTNSFPNLEIHYSAYLAMDEQCSIIINDIAKSNDSLEANLILCVQSLYHIDSIIKDGHDLANIATRDPYKLRQKSKSFLEKASTLNLTMTHWSEALSLSNDTIRFCHERAMVIWHAQDLSLTKFNDISHCYRTIKLLRRHRSDIIVMRNLLNRITKLKLIEDQRDLHPDLIRWSNIIKDVDTMFYHSNGRRDLHYLFKSISILDSEANECLARNRVTETSGMSMLIGNTIALLSSFADYIKCYANKI